MLYNQKQFSQDQLLMDLLAVKARISRENGWTQHEFKAVNGQSACLIATCEMITDHKIGFTILRGSLTERDHRLGRMVFAIYVAVYGPEAPTDITLSEAMRKVAQFNDHHNVNKDVVLLALDKAIQYILEPAEVPS